MIKKITLILIVLLGNFGFGQTFADSTHILFIGNSITYFNSMPFLFKKIANTKNKKVAINQHTPGGTGFVNHVNDPQVYQKIKSRTWDYVVLQPGSGESTSTSYLPGITALRGKILKDSILKYSPCAKVFLYEIPYGVPSQQQFQVYFDVQKRIKDSMTKVSHIMQVPMIPAGESIRAVYTDNQNELLHVGYNDIHPNAKGSFIIASTIFSNLFQENAAGSNYFGEIGSVKANAYFVVTDQVSQNNLDQYFTNLYPRVQFSNQNNALQVQFTSLSHSATSYLWDFGEGHVSTEQNPNHTYAQSGNYQVKLTINTGNCPIKIARWITVSNLSTQEISQETRALYPNPNFGEFYIKLNDEVLGYQIFTADGRLVSSKKWSSSPGAILKINERLPKGNYFIKMQAKQSEYKTQFIVK